MCKCDKCLFFVKNGFTDMSFSCDTCSLKLRIEELKKSRGEKYNLYNSLLSGNKEDCVYFHDKDFFIDFVIDCNKNNFD